MRTFTVRDYNEKTDAQGVGLVIADTYSRFNLTFAPADDLHLFLGPFQHAASPAPAHRQAIAQAIRTSMVFVAEEEGSIVGVLRGRKGRLQSLFVSGEHHRRGIGRALVEHFERVCIQQGVAQIKVAATLFAVPFYLSQGYKRTTGVRPCWSFEGRGLKYQPMKKALAKWEGEMPS